ncbi:MAG: hypothetical protein KUG60_00980 [Gammaproteobacteria bacterium]|nr:hypothetical protein [Gammaproteobacteria bacterium]
MLNPNFKNGQGVDVQAAFASFIVMMGLLFLIDAAAGLHSSLALLTVLAGVLWFVFRQVHHHKVANHQS